MLAPFLPLEGARSLLIPFPVLRHLFVAMLGFVVYIAAAAAAADDDDCSVQEVGLVLLEHSV